MEDEYKIRVTRELLDTMLTRDQDGNLLTYEVSEPDLEGFRYLVVSVHRDDNLVQSYRERRCVRCAHRRDADARNEGGRLLHLADTPWCAVACIDVDMDDHWLSVDDDFGCEFFERMS